MAIVLLKDKDKTFKKSLKEHREAINNNPNAYTTDLERCERTLFIKDGRTKQRKDPSISNLTESRLIKSNHPHLAKQLITLLFKAQNNKPFFHIEQSALPMCWNAPKDWNKDYIKYEWGHLYSHNQLSDNYTETFANVCLQSARCNQHIQTSMDIDELLIYGGELSQVIQKNLESREKLFSSQEWADLVGPLQTLNENFHR
tara:strand:- start:45 stop:647 length:603 start_codon:yes stop_codon:yes gene_type:complete